MKKVRLYDATSNPQNREIVLESLRRITPFQDIQIYPREGVVNREEIKLVRDIINKSYNKKRNQVYLDDLVYFLDCHTPIGNNNDYKVILLEQDLHNNRTSWVFGTLAITQGKQYVFLSTHRMVDPIHTYFWMTHELGHLFGAAREGRTNTYESGGPHCSNNWCAMRQIESVQESLKYAYEIINKNPDMYCQQCKQDLLINR
jgi:predicted Zn-dependent protease